MTPDTTQQPALFPPATPLARPEATEEQIADLLARFKLRRAALVDSYMAGLDHDELLMPSTMAPLATIQGVIAAIEAELAQGRP